MVITCSGFCRKWNAPCGPDEPKSTPSGKTLPCLTRLAASATLSVVMKFSVPSSSASPHRPQFRTSSATRRKSLMLAITQPFAHRSRHRSVAEDGLPNRAAVHPDHLSGDVAGRLAVQEHQHAACSCGLGRGRVASGRRPETPAVCGPKLIKDRCVGDPRCGAVDPNPLGAQHCDVRQPIEDDRLLGQPVPPPSARASGLR